MNSRATDAKPACAGSEGLAKVGAVSNCRRGCCWRGITAVAVKQIARELTVSPEELQRRSLQAFIERERRLTSLDIADLQDRYGVQTAAELADKIEGGEVYAHPAWEELIEWERLEAYLTRLEQWQAELEQPGV